ncbi:MFS transporter [uncultured Piscinibacter sp.]|uniref:MFS transporter n=1 Tax=uncultured Piscinibacter sp. TaxID=1131835 RepID=UPI0026119B9F|nr:MFS transporter [uncultured Piscinibacter sp.]
MHGQAKPHLDDDEPAFRWIVLTAAALSLAVAMGQLVNGLSVYFIPLERAFGWPRAEVALINTIGLLGVALGGIVVGRVVDRIGTRRVVLGAAIVFSLSILLASRAEALWQFYVLFGIAGFVGGGAMFAPLIALVGNWFRSGAGLAIGIASAGQALGQGAVPFGTAYLIDSLGWRGAMVTQGLVSLAVLLPMATLLREPPWRSGGAAAATAPAPPLPGRVAVPWLSLAVLGCCTCMSVPLMHLVPLIQGCGIPAPAAGGVLFLMLTVAICGRVAFGKLADHIGAIPAYMTASLWQTVLVYFFTQMWSLDSFYVLAAIYGFGYAGVMTGLLMTARELTDPTRRASQMGIILALAWLGHGLGGYQGGLFYDLTGGYRWTYANAALAGVFNLVLVGALYWRVHRRGRPLLTPSLSRA